MARHTWTKEDTCSLIEEYEKNAMLWNVKCEEYRNRALKNGVLSKIASKFNCSIREVKRKLHNLRNQVSQELNKIKKKKGEFGTDEVYTSTWPYFSALKFLIPGLINRSNTLNVGDDQDNAECNVEIQETENYINHRMKRTIQQGKTNGTKRKYASDDDSARVFKRELYIIQKEPDENDRFGEYVAMELNSLQFDSNRRRLKSEIRRAIARIADEDDISYSSSVSTIPSPYPSPLQYPAQSSSP